MYTEPLDLPTTASAMAPADGARLYLAALVYHGNHDRMSAVQPRPDEVGGRVSMRPA